MAVGDDRISIQGPGGATYWYNPNTGRVFRQRRDDPSEYIRGASVERGRLILPTPGPTGGSYAPTPAPTPGFGPTPPSYTPPTVPGTPTDPSTPPMPNIEPPDGQRWAYNAEGRYWYLELIEEEDPDKETPEEEAERLATRAELETFFRQYFRASDISELMAFVDEQLAEDNDFNTILLELRNTPVYQRNFPENQQRLANGSTWMGEADILEYRATVARIAKQLSGVTLSTDPQSPDYLKTIGKLIAGDVDPQEWARRLDDWEKFSLRGPEVMSLLEDELKRPVTDEEGWMFMSMDFETSELDRAYENALYRRGRQVAGFGAGTSDEADLLRSYGVSVEQSFANYLQMAQGGGGLAGLRRTEALQRLDQQIALGVEEGALPATGNELFNDTPYNILFRAIQKGDSDALEYLRRQMSLESARFGSGGGPVTQGTQIVGALSPDERRRG